MIEEQKQSRSEMIKIYFTRYRLSFIYHLSFNKDLSINFIVIYYNLFLCPHLEIT